MTTPCSTPSTINQSVIVDRMGNISVHGRSALYLPVQFLDASNNPLDASAWVLKFEVKNKVSRPLLAAPTNYGVQFRTIALSQEDVASIGTTAIPFALIDNTYTLQDGSVISQVRWSGLISWHGFTSPPTSEPAL